MTSTELKMAEMQLSIDRRTLEGSYLLENLKNLISYIDSDQRILQQVYGIRNRWKDSKIRESYLKVIENHKHLDQLKVKETSNENPS
jgi:hypothetical protein